jgi:D-alanine-D-alanine ligase-like ATP-grasp enzyme
MTLVPKTKLPFQVKKAAYEIVDVLKHYCARYYTLDFILDHRQRPYLLEMNTMPGAYFNPDDIKSQLAFFQRLVKVFKTGGKVTC